MKYIIEIKYVASVTHAVDANDEGQALELARQKAEETDLNEFVIKEEMESRILNSY